jgi:hypothetical protein
MDTAFALQVNRPISLPIRRICSICLGLENNCTVLHQLHAELGSLIGIRFIAPSNGCMRPYDPASNIPPRAYLSSVLRIPVSSSATDSVQHEWHTKGSRIRFHEGSIEIRENKGVKWSEWVAARED